MAKPHLEVADVFHAYGEDYRKKNGHSMSPQQWRVMRAIEICRTQVLGGHINECDLCGHQVISYNSCKNRHCPKCQSLAKAEWIEARRNEILPVEYYHTVFTLPACIAPLALQNKDVIYNLLFQAVSKTLLTLARDPKHLGADIGFVALLHTWGQKLLPHFHIHCIVPGGGLSPDGQRWISCRPGFFLPVRVLSRLYRRLFLKLLTKAFDQHKLEFHGRIKSLSKSDAFNRLIRACREKEWVVYAKPPFDGPEKVLDYLGRYTHRIAISNHRLVEMKDGKVSFTWKDYRKESRRKTLTLDAHEFIRRFLLHVLPNGFVRIRYYGLLANCHRGEKLTLCRERLNVKVAGGTGRPEKKSWDELFKKLTGKDPLECPMCKRGRLVCSRSLPSVHPLHTRAPP